MTLTPTSKMEEKQQGILYVFYGMIVLMVCVFLYLLYVAFCPIACLKQAVCCIGENLSKVGCCKKKKDTTEINPGSALLA